MYEVRNQSSCGRENFENLLVSVQQLVTFRHFGNKHNVLSNKNLSNRAYMVAIIFYLSDFYYSKWGLDDEERIQKTKG